MNKLQKLWYSCKEIGIPQMADYAIYLVQKKSGSLIKKTPLNGFALDFNPQEVNLKIPITPFNPQLQQLLEKDRIRIFMSADEIISGWYQPFGGEKTPLSFATGVASFVHWSEVGDQINGRDIKWLWEPARFTWVYDLAKAWLLTKEDHYPKFFWQKFTEFVQANPVNSAPNWSSAQEIAMRMIAWLMAYQVFKDSQATTAEHTSQLVTALWQHASRIPSTLGYARSQNNNHLLSEALGMVIAGSLFGGKSSRAHDWLKLGLTTFDQAILKQVEKDGTYSQHSANYHRLMLHLALIYRVYAKHLSIDIPQKILDRLASSTNWLGAQLDPISGRLPNLGHNDGSLLFPQGSVDYRDYRPTLQAASLAFTGQACLPSGAWDELVLWLGLSEIEKVNDPHQLTSPAIHAITEANKTALLRGVTFHGRPAHADQLHLDLWWDGLNIAQDAGTYAYNDAPPWQNPFSSTLVHNTITINDRDQMEKASKFLWLRQAQAKWQTAPSKDILMASHDGYRRMGAIHQRIATFSDSEHLEVIDQIHFFRKTDPKQIILHWLLADWQWQLDGSFFTLTNDKRSIKIGFNATAINHAASILPSDVSLIRGGETLAGRRYEPILGWASDTYGEKHAALSLSLQYQTKVGIQIVTRFEFSKIGYESPG
ncbi:MAG: hypothetical protein CVU42_09290 [Chloroflexi bacterium HGW-Chloroflexi-4]|nr:MAG: hypothetical protein CVU42_09290 [Chloroflexi bacterium HGW-Chloroflexi-4]